MFLCVCDAPATRFDASHNARKFERAKHFWGRKKEEKNDDEEEDDEKFKVLSVRIGGANAVAAAASIFQLRIDVTTVEDSQFIFKWHYLY